MYIRERARLGDGPGVTLAMRPKPYLNLDRFRFDKSTLTDRMRNMVDKFSNQVILSWNSKQPIQEIRLIGHTDGTGSEKYNVDLGDRRAEAVKALLENRLKRLGSKVKIMIERSPGETKPIVDNRTSDGRERNRRVEVFIKARVLPPPTPPKKFSPWDWSKLKLPDEPIIRTRPDPIFQPIPPAPKGQSLESWLDDKLSGIHSRWLRRKIRDTVLSGACALLETLFTQAGGSLRETDKKQLRKQCLEATKNPIR
jgi:hypothetical protein